MNQGDLLEGRKYARGRVYWPALRMATRKYIVTVVRKSPDVSGVLGHSRNKQVVMKIDSRVITS